MKDPRSYNVGKSDYSKKKIQPWDLWLEYDLNPFDADIVKRVLRTKEGESRILDYKKIIHVCEERIRQLEDSTTVSVILGKKEEYNKEDIKELLKKATNPQWRDLLEQKLNDLENE